MSRGLTGLVAAAALVLSAPLGLAQEAPPCRSRSVNVEHANYAARTDSAVSFICMQGSRTRIHLEVRQMPITAVLSALRAPYNVSYRSSIPLDETRNGVYSGPLWRVISHLLSNYNYVIKLDNSSLAIDVFGKKGEHAAPAPLATEVGDKPARSRVSRTH